jgi:carboxymethylenebutenolidase
MNFQFRLLDLRRAGIGLCLAYAALSFRVSWSFSQESDAEAAKKSAQLKHIEQVIADDLPYGTDAWRVQWLAESPRRHEMAKIPGGKRTLQAFVAYPTTKEKVPVVLMLPEDQGLNTWARKMADEIAMMGYIAIVPDLHSGYGPNGGGIDSFPDIKSAMIAHYLFTDEIMTADINAWADWGKKLEQANGKLAASGFGWGAGRAFRFATQRKDLAVAFIFYDVAPPAEMLAGLTAPVYGFYAEIDPRVMKSLDATKATMAALGKKYEPVIYAGAEHMFVRLAEMPGNRNPANIEARNLAVARLQQLLKGM